MKDIKLLDMTVDGGKTYYSIGAYSTLNRAKDAVKGFIKKYNKTRDEEKGEVEYHYNDELWTNADGADIIFPFGPGAEYRIRKITLNQQIKVKE